MKQKILIALFSTFSFFSFTAHAASTPEARADKDQIKAAKAIAKENKMTYLTKGLSNIISRDKQDYSTWGIVWTCKEKLELDDAKALAIKVATSILDAVQNSPACMSYHKEAYIWLKTKSDGRPPELDPKKLEAAENRPTINDLSFRIAFWDENVERMLPPYIAEISFIEGKLYYHLANPTTLELEEPIIEPFSYPWKTSKEMQKRA